MSEVKMMTGPQVNLLRKLIGEKLLPPEEWANILLEYDIEKEDDLYHLNVEQAGLLIARLIKKSNKW